jgi:glycosyltransferase involved in cell wall biosynthesis|tara:strand:+ start:58 stop:948 length:891 start_codon:yes stop_codon:yes gene_type:complete
MKKITVFTPTYNRAYCLHQVYESLIRQSNQNFCWLIVDDGSNDNTKELVRCWNKDGKIEIIYIFQKNQGMHGAHNTAYANIETELNICIDSDDFLPNNAIALILEKWEAVKEDDSIAGIVGLDADKNRNIIGTAIPKELKRCTLSGLYQNHGVKGDKKLVYRTDIVKKYPPYPIFKGERFVPLDYLYLLIDQDYHLAPLNEVLIIVDYQLDGSTLNIFKQYRKNPRGFAFSRISRIQYGYTFKERFKNCIHLVSSLFLLKDISLVYNINKTLLLLSLPFGLALFFYIRIKTYKNYE